MKPTEGRRNMKVTEETGKKHHASAASGLPPKEIRIALVLYGGVSLAVYMNGVVQELLALVRARRGAFADRVADAAGGGYGALLDRLESEVVIDIVAGNSAGGINGVLLSKALAAGTDLAEIKSLWRDAADLRDLLALRKGETDALLSGSYMYEQLMESFASMSRQTEAEPELARERQERIGMLDLFVSASDVRGRRWSWTDAKGQQIEGLRHGVVLQRKYRTVSGGGGTARERGYTQNDFDGAANDELLARMSRATSAMPAAFPGQPFAMEEVYGARNTFDQRDTVYLHDGLLTDNRPFRPVLEKIFRRPSDREVDRWLLYVDPTPVDTHLAMTADAYRTKPNVMESALSYFGVPRYQSIYEQLRSIEQYQEKVDTLTGVLDLLEDDNGRVRAAEACELLTRLPAYAPYCKLRYDQFCHSLLGQVSGYFGGKGDFKEDLDRSFPPLEQLRAVLGDMQKEIGRHVAELSLPDIEFFCRFFLYHIKQLNRKLERNSLSTADRELLLQRKTALWGAVDSLRRQQWLWWNLDAELAAKRQWLDQAPPDGAFAAKVRTEAELLAAEQARHRPLAEALERLYRGDNPRHAAEQIMHFLQHSVHYCLLNLEHPGHILDAITPGSGGADPSVPAAPGSAGQASAAPADFIAQLQNSLCGFLAVDVFLYPLTYQEVGELNRIDVVRISAGDASSLGLSGSDKLVGEDLQAFAGFLSRKWRANDMLWGRLDTADILFNYMNRSQRAKLEAEHAAMDTPPSEIAQALAEWDAYLLRTRIARFRTIIEEEIRYVDPKLEQAYMELSAEMERTDDTGRLELLQQFFAYKYKVGKESWLNLPLKITLGNTMDVLHNAAGALRRYFRRAPLPTLLLSIASLGIWLVRGTVRILLPRRK
ncbi:patatin-like protein [Paenibacillus gansuensis]|uniref:Patatin-like protein n=1 Tax=Paenibacillus gansuensis TaxID=306542 RepID=A0ABW5PLX6_9BACL